MVKHDVGTHVRIVCAGTDTDRSGIVIESSMWTYNVEHGNDPGDRTVQMDDNGEHLVFAQWMMVESSG